MPNSVGECTHLYFILKTIVLFVTIVQHCWDVETGREIDQHKVTSTSLRRPTLHVVAFFYAKVSTLHGRPYTIGPDQF